MNDTPVQFLWPTPILKKSLENHGAVNAALVELFTRHRDENGGQTGNVYSSGDDLLQRYDHPALSELFAFVSNGVFEIAQAMNSSIWKATGASKLQMQIVGAWFQIQNRYGFHDIHNHGNCSWSGVYYVQIDRLEKRQSHPSIGATNGVTRFYGHQLPLLGGAHMDMGNAYLQNSSFDVQPEAGTLIVFPSWLNHKAMPYDGDADRIIVSFNAQVHGEQGNKAFGYGFH
jgi:Putative 2OG-Fe(II) oxygenase